MLRMKSLLLLAGTIVAFTLVFVGCSGVTETPPSNGVGTPPAADTAPPSTPTDLTGAAAGAIGANLSWNASTDNVGVTGYIVRRNGVLVAMPATTSYADTGLSAATT